MRLVVVLAASLAFAGCFVEQCDFRPDTAAPAETPDGAPDGD